MGGHSQGPKNEISSYNCPLDSTVNTSINDIGTFEGFLLREVLAGSKLYIDLIDYHIDIPFSSCSVCLFIPKTVVKIEKSQNHQLGASNTQYY